MSAIARPSIERVSRQDFRAWAEQQSSGRFERHDGWTIAMAPERAGHAHRKAIAWLVLRQAIAAARLPCQVFPDGMTVEVEDSDYEPDCVLRCGPNLPADAVTIPDPLILVEVLSLSTRSVDLTRKQTDYFKLPSVFHYLVLWPDGPRVLHHRREVNGSISSRTATEGVIRLDPPGIDVHVADLYQE